jgi:monovalent cation:H+ antiporter-2, CPA2 family
VMENYLYPVVIAISVLTIFTTPYFMKLADPVYRLLKQLLPAAVFNRLDQPKSVRTPSTSGRAWSELLRSTFTYVLVMSTLIIAIISMATHFLHPFLIERLSARLSNGLTFCITLIALSPFLRALMSNNVASPSFWNLWMEKSANKKYLLGLVALRLIVVFLTLIYVINRFFQIPIYINGILAIILVIAITKSKWLLKRFWHMESRFLINLNERFMEESFKKIEAHQGVMQLSEMHNNHWLYYKLYTCAFRIRSDADWIGQQIRELHVRQELNLMIIRVRTNKNEYINIPSGDYRFNTGDSIRLVGKKSQLRKFQENEKLGMEFVNHSFMTIHGFSKLEIERKKKAERLICSGIPLKPESPLTGKNLMDSNIGATTKCLVIGLERDGKQVVNPDAHSLLKAGDVVWIIGEEKPVSHHVEQNVYFV